MNWIFYCECALRSSDRNTQDRWKHSTSDWYKSLEEIVTELILGENRKQTRTTIEEIRY